MATPRGATTLRSLARLEAGCRQGCLEPEQLDVCPRAVGSLTARVRNARALQRVAACRAFGSSREKRVGSEQPSLPTRELVRPTSNRYPGSPGGAAETPSGPHS